LHALQCNCGGVGVYPLVVHFEMIFKSVHSFRCYDNIHVRIHCKCIRRMRNVSEYLYSLYFWHCAAFLYLFASVATIAYSMSFLWLPVTRISDTVVACRPIVSKNSHFKRFDFILVTEPHSIFLLSLSECLQLGIIYTFSMEMVVRGASRVLRATTSWVCC